MKPGLGGPDRDVEDLGCLRERQVEIEVHDHDRTLIEAAGRASGRSDRARRQIGRSRWLPLGPGRRRRGSPPDFDAASDARAGNTPERRDDEGRASHASGSRRARSAAKPGRALPGRRPGQGRRHEARASQHRTLDRRKPSPGRRTPHGRPPALAQRAPVAWPTCSTRRVRPRSLIGARRRSERFPRFSPEPFAGRLASFL